MTSPYSNRELDHYFKDVRKQLDRIEAQTTKHNGRLSRLERIVLVVGTATGIILMMNGSELVGFIMTII